MNAGAINRKFVSLWLLVHSMVWPMGIVSAAWSGWWWTNWLVEHVPGKPQLTVSIWPDHAYIGLFLWSTFCIGGAIVGIWVGIAQWLLLRNRYQMTARWVWINGFIWACCGVLLRLLMLLERPANLLYALLPFVVGGLITGYWLEQYLAKFSQLQRPMRSGHTVNPTYDRPALYRMIFLGIGLGLITSTIAVSRLL